MPVAISSFARLPHVLRKRGAVEGPSGPRRHLPRVCRSDGQKLLGPHLVRTLFTEGGRFRGRDRNAHRSSRTDVLDARLRLSTLNLQNTNPMAISDTVRVAELLRYARHFSWDAILLSDLGHFESDFPHDDETSCPPIVVFLEEFLLIQHRKVGVFFFWLAHARQDG